MILSETIEAISVLLNKGSFHVQRSTTFQWRMLRRFSMERTEISTGQRFITSCAGFSSLLALALSVVVLSFE
jgi:hypothetical protein